MSVSKKPNPAPHCLIFDPIPFNGGSKIASGEIIRQSIRAGVCFTIFTCNPDSWYDLQKAHHSRISLVSFRTPIWLSQATTGWKFWLKHWYFMLLLSFCLIRNRHTDTLAGISGPGVDMAIYACQKLFNLRIIQFIHGPVSDSLSVGYCLTQATSTFFLDSSKPSISRALHRYFNRILARDSGQVMTGFTTSQTRYTNFVNGISLHRWPTQCQYSRPGLYWAASLLKWKGLDTLTQALQLIPESNRPHTEICYIRPENINLPQCKAPVDIPGIVWHQQPEQLDRIRARCNIFISTSNHEPFGLSILESLAAGLCVVIPQDNAYWDQHLTHMVNCIKYTAEDTASLAKAIQTLTENPAHIRRIGREGRNYAENYQAEVCYQPIIAKLSEQRPNQTFRQ